MKIFIRVFIIFINFGILKAQANNEFSTFDPKLYNGIWPDFCFEHLQNFPEECSEQHIDENGHEYLNYIKDNSSECFIDKEIIFRLSNYLHLIPSNSICDFLYCKNCHKPVIRGCFSDYDEDEDESFPIICYKCKCLSNWYDENDRDNYKEESFVEDYWVGCEKKACPHLYFNIATKQYIAFFENYLRYCYENNTCMCYWPFLSKIACEINDIVYENIYSLLESKSLLLNELKNSKKYLYLTNCTIHGALVYLFVHSFFYSQYRQILLNLAHFSESNFTDNSNVIKVLNVVYKTIDEVMPKFVNLYSQCLEKHPHPKIFYERGMIYFHQGKDLEAINDISELVSFAEGNDFEDLLTSDLYFKEGESYAELGLYDQAIEKLTKAIKKDPNNKEAYLERSFAYFELGKFDLATDDFLHGDAKISLISTKDKVSLNFAKGLIFGLVKGGKDGTNEFIPSALSSLHGLANGLWAFACEPIDCSKGIINACQDSIKFIKENTSKEIIKELIPELKELVNNWDNLSNEKKGDLTGYIIGKYGIDILITSGSIKAIKYYKDLKKANALLTLEKVSRDAKKAQIIFQEGLKKYEKVESITKTFGLADINPKIYLQLERQLLKDGKESIYKGLNQAEKTLQQHKDKLPSLKYKSQVQGTIKNVESQIETIKKFIKDKGLSK
jgi:tetratricopeptide (TPR) repeat protein